MPYTVDIELAKCFAGLSPVIWHPGFLAVTNQYFLKTHKPSLNSYKSLYFFSHTNLQILPEFTPLQDDPGNTILNTTTHLKVPSNLIPHNSRHKHCALGNWKGHSPRACLPLLLNFHHFLCLELVWPICQHPNPLGHYFHKTFHCFFTSVCSHTHNHILITNIKQSFPQAKERERSYILLNTLLCTWHCVVFCP